MAKTDNNERKNEVGNLCQENADDVTRRSFRGSVSEANHIQVEIAGQHYAVLDIGSHGLGILLPSGDSLVPGESYDINLSLGSRLVSLRGLIRHITRDDDGGGFHCGIQLLDLDRESEKQLQAFVLAQRHQLFGEGTP